jgi:hypothetical protein
VSDQPDHDEPDEPKGHGWTASPAAFDKMARDAMAAGDNATAALFNGFSHSEALQRIVNDVAAIRAASPADHYPPEAEQDPYMRARQALNENDYLQALVSGVVSIAESWRRAYPPPSPRERRRNRPWRGAGEVWIREQPDGTWRGIWTRFGDDEAAAREERGGEPYEVRTGTREEVFDWARSVPAKGRLFFVPPDTWVDIDAPEW